MNSPQASPWPRVTVVTPSFRQAAYLETTILSVLGQCYPNLEYIIMDGGSDDGSVAIIERYASQLAYWQSTRDRGQADAINQGFTRATGDILCWLNSDDFFLPGTLLTVARALTAKTHHPTLLYGSCLCFREADGSARILKARPHDPQLLRETDYIYQPSCFWTRSLWQQTGALDADLHFGFDWDWFIRAMSQGEFIKFDGLFSAYRRHAAHKSGSGGRQRMEEIVSVVRRHGSTEQIRAYEYASGKIESFERRQLLTKRFHRWRIPYAASMASMLSPDLWQLPPGVSSGTFTHCLGMLASS